MTSAAAIYRVVALALSARTRKYNEAKRESQDRLGHANRQEHDGGWST
jgi:hypothetical protein